MKYGRGKRKHKTLCLMRKIGQWLQKKVRKEIKSGKSASLDCCMVSEEDTLNDRLNEYFIFSWYFAWSCIPKPWWLGRPASLWWQADWVCGRPSPGCSTQEPVWAAFCSEWGISKYATNLVCCYRLCVFYSVHVIAFHIYLGSSPIWCVTDTCNLPLRGKSRAQQRLWAG